MTLEIHQLWGGIGHLDNTSVSHFNRIICISFKLPNWSIEKERAINNPRRRIDFIRVFVIEIIEFSMIWNQMTGKSSENWGIFASGLTSHCLPLTFSWHVENLEPLMLKSCLQSYSLFWIIFDEKGDKVFGFIRYCHLITPFVGSFNCVLENLCDSVIIEGKSSC